MEQQPACMRQSACVWRRAELSRLKWRRAPWSWLAQHGAQDERFRLSVKTLNAVSVIITCSNWWRVEGEGARKVRVANWQHFFYPSYFSCHGMQSKCRLEEETTSKPCRWMAVLIEDTESDSERDVCQILEMFSPIILTSVSLQFGCRSLHLVLLYLG